MTGLTARSECLIGSPQRVMCRTLHHPLGEVLLWAELLCLGLRQEANGELGGRAAHGRACPVCACGTVGAADLSRTAGVGAGRGAGGLGRPRPSLRSATYFDSCRFVWPQMAPPVDRSTLRAGTTLNWQQDGLEAAFSRCLDATGPHRSGRRPSAECRGGIESGPTARLREGGFRRPRVT